jgi:hypothetical protein
MANEAVVVLPVVQLFDDGKPGRHCSVVYFQFNEPQFNESSRREASQSSINASPVSDHDFARTDRSQAGLANLQLLRLLQLRNGRPSAKW